MTETMMKMVIDCSTGETVYEPMTAEEIADFERTSALYAEQEEARRIEQEALEQSRASALAKLTALGLTEEEAQALVK